MAQSQKKRRYKPRLIWSERGEVLLLDLWKQYAPEFRINKKHHTVYEKMRLEFVRNDEEVSTGEIKTKMTNMSKKYR